MSGRATRYAGGPTVILRGWIEEYLTLGIPIRCDSAEPFVVHPSSGLLGHFRRLTSQIRGLHVIHEEIGGFADEPSLGVAAQIAILVHGVVGRAAAFADFIEQLPGIIEPGREHQTLGG